MNTGVYRIGTVADMIGVPRNTLLAWERRYGLLDPDRTESGYRTYTDADVAKLRRIKGYIDQGYKISEAVALVGRPEPQRQAAADRDLDALEAVRAELKAALLAFDRPAADTVRRRLVLFSFQRSIDEVYMPLLREVGDAWHAGEVSVAQEHFVSAFCREQLTAMLHSLGAGPEAGPLAVCAGIPGEAHELGLLAIAVKLALRGWRVSYLGADLPVGDLASAVAAQGATLVCQSIVHRRPVDSLLEYARALRDRLDPSVRVVIGGAGATDLGDAVPGVWVFHDLDEALARVDAADR